MKKWISVLLCMAVLLTFTACAQQKSVVTLDSFTVNTENLTITDGTHTYTYMCIGMGTENNMNYTNTIFYPNGAEYTEHIEYKNGIRSSVSVEKSEDYDDQRYTPGDTLLQYVNQANELVAQQRGPDVNWAYLIGGAICIIAGVLGLIFPEETWYIAHYSKRWQYQDLDPTEEGLVMAKVGDVLCILIGIICVLAAF